MNKLSGLMLVLTFLVSTSLLAESEWKKYNAAKWGFEMSVPVGTKCKDYTKGQWRGLMCHYQGVKLAGVSRNGLYSNPKIVNWAVKNLGVHKKYWTKVDEGEQSKGWTWYKVYKAQKGNQLWLAGTGVGKTKSYLIFLKTTVSDFEENEDAYTKWFESVQLSK